MRPIPIPRPAFAAFVAALLAFPVAPALAQQIETATAEYVSVERERILDGVIEAINESTVSAQVSARVIDINFDVDDRVEQGALIVEFDDTEYQARLREARARREAARAGLEAARAQFSRIENLFERRTASQAEYDKARADMETARAELNAADAVIARIEQQLGYTKVRAPYSGIVTERHIELGETANPGTPLMTGFSLDQLRAVVNFPQRLIGSMREQRKAQVLMPGDGERRIDGGEITIFPYALEGSSTIPVRVRLPDEVDGLFPGMLVKVAFAMGSRLKLAVPAEALVYRSEVVAVYVVGEDGAVSLRHVRTGNTDAEGRVEILAGLEDGERVAVQPALAAAQLKRQRGE